MDNLQHIGGATNGLTVLYDDIEENLMNTGIIKHFDIYNSQEVLLMDEQENMETPFMTPAVFIAFENINYDTKVENVQWGNAVIKLRIVDFHLRHYPKAILDLAAIVQAVVHGMKPKNNDYTSLMRISTKQDQEFSGLITYDMFFDVTYYADEAHKPDIEKMVSEYLLNRQYN